MDPDASIPPEPAPSVFNYVLSFLLVGVAWGFTTPFIRRAAADFNARQEKQATGTPTPRGRSLSTVDEEEESQLLVPIDADGEEGEGDGEGEIRRRSSSRQRESEDGRVDEAPLPAWRTQQSQSWLKTKFISVFWTVVNLLRTPAYSVPLVINLTGSIWFFLLVGQHELSLTVPLANSSAFLFTVLGEWYVDRKVIAKETWLGLILVLGGIGLCVHSKNQAS
ncbi:hypothetical protein N7478_001858 [Penicillium angulare]|uniref:uncharacterized protein n=1 Tax=Penicillium angulare TaxID=116970 RepID=UPI002540389A|nr:uncharacterized protein N7478_001858 [Penicillium angulare]KAJ5288828.1 hypothetical protein N7478_001858 [Penicillium angulare]